MNREAKQERSGPPPGRGTLAVLLLLALGVSAPRQLEAAAFRVLPLSVSLNAREQRATLTVVNDGQEPLTVQLRAMAWKQDQSGKDYYEPTDDIVYFPKIATIEAGKERVVRVGYEQAAQLSTEKTYRLFIQELPVVKPGETALKIALRVAVPVFVAPRSPEPKLGVQGIGAREGKLQVRIGNGGNSHASIGKLLVVGLDQGGNEVVSREIVGWYVLSGAVRSFPVDLGPEECRRIGRVRVVVSWDGNQLGSTHDVSAALCEELEAGEAEARAKEERSPSGDR